MSFSTGRDYKKAQVEFGMSRPKLVDLNLKAMGSSEYVSLIIVLVNDRVRMKEIALEHFPQEISTSNTTLPSCIILCMHV